jgi:hypothetical protein
VLVVGMSVLAISGVPFFTERYKRQRRWIYWSAFLVGSALMAVAVSWRGWGTSLGMFFMGASIALITALRFDRTLLKFGNKSISHSSQEQVVTVALYWWVIAAGSVSVAVGIYLGGWVLQFTVAVGLGVIFAAAWGWVDASEGERVARGQKIQFAIASLASVMMFALPPIAYLAAYFAAKKWTHPHAGKHAAPPSNAEE